MAGADHREKLGKVVSVRVSWTPLPRLSDRAQASEILDGLKEDRWAAGSGFVKRDGGRWVWMGDLQTSTGEIGLVIKGRPRSWLGLIPDHHAIKQAIGAARLRSAGVVTSELLGLFEVRTESGGAEQWLALRALPGETLAHAMARDARSFADGAALARRAGGLVRTLCDAGLFNRDHKASNLIVLDSGEIGVVDTVAVRRRRSGDEFRQRMLLAMCKELAGIGALPRRAQLMRCLRAASGDSRADWAVIAQAMRDAGDTTPRVDPLGGH